MRIALSEVVRDFPAVSERALTEPVTITRDDRDSLVLMSAEEYARLRAGRRRVVVDVLDAEMVEAIARAEVPAEYAYLDAELEGWEPDPIR